MTFQNTNEENDFISRHQYNRKLCVCVCVSALKAVRDRGEKRRCYGNLKKRKCAGYAVNSHEVCDLKPRFPIYQLQHTILIIQIKFSFKKTTQCIVYFSKNY